MWGVIECVTVGRDSRASFPPVSTWPATVNDRCTRHPTLNSFKIVCTLLNPALLNPQHAARRPLLAPAMPMQAAACGSRACAWRAKRIAACQRGAAGEVCRRIGPVAGGVLSGWFWLGVAVSWHSATIPGAVAAAPSAVGLVVVVVRRGWICCCCRREEGTKGCIARDRGVGGRQDYIAACDAEEFELGEQDVAGHLGSRR